MVAFLNQLEEKTFPHFESFIIEEEEGSGIEMTLMCFPVYNPILVDFLTAICCTRLSRWLWHCLQGSEKE